MIFDNIARVRNLNSQPETALFVQSAHNWHFKQLRQQAHRLAPKSMLVESV